MFKKLALLLTCFLFISTAAAHSETMLMGKPVQCTLDSEVGRGLIFGFYELGLRPILGFIGSSYTTKGFKFPSEYIIMYNTEDNQIVVIETRRDGNICIITGSSKSWLSFDGEELEELLMDIFREEL